MSFSLIFDVSISKLFSTDSFLLLLSFNTSTASRFEEAFWNSSVFLESKNSTFEILLFFLTSTVSGTIVTGFWDNCFVFSDSGKFCLSNAFEYFFFLVSSKVSCLTKALFSLLWVSGTLVVSIKLFFSLFSKTFLVSIYSVSISLFLASIIFSVSKCFPVFVLLNARTASNFSKALAFFLLLRSEASRVSVFVLLILLASEDSLTSLNVCVFFRSSEDPFLFSESEEFFLSIIFKKLLLLVSSNASWISKTLLFSVLLNARTASSFSNTLAFRRFLRSDLSSSLCVDFFFRSCCKSTVFK